MIRLQQNLNSIVIKIEAAIYNSSSQPFNLFTLKSSIERQLMSVYHTSVGKYNLDLQLDISCIYKERKLTEKKILFQIVDEVPGNNPAEADFKGLRIKLNKVHLRDIMEMKNTRTIPHEIGHLFGWDHPHARGKYESINPTAHELEKRMTEDERKQNLMSQTWYAQKAGIPLERAMQLSEKQIELLILNDRSGALNKNHHFKKFLFWKKIV